MFRSILPVALALTVLLTACDPAADAPVIDDGPLVELDDGTTLETSPALGGTPLTQEELMEVAQLEPVRPDPDQLASPPDPRFRHLEGDKSDEDDRMVARWREQAPRATAATIAAQQAFLREAESLKQQLSGEALEEAWAELKERRLGD